MIVIDEKNLSLAWAKAFLNCFSARDGLIAPCAINFNVESTSEVDSQFIHTNVNNLLRQKNLSPIETVANTIFPESIWKISAGDREVFYNRYIKMWPRIKKCQANSHGVYFQRLIMYTPKVDGGCAPINQLEKVIEMWHGGTHRKSALQVTIFDPTRDLVPGPRRGFPCLQQLIFHPVGSNGKEGLILIGLYANQLLIEKAYGNYLGLYHLGKFMAGQMRVQLKSVTCIASNLRLSESYGKGELEPLKKIVEETMH